MRFSAALPTSAPVPHPRPPRGVHEVPRPACGCPFYRPYVSQGSRWFQVGKFEDCPVYPPWHTLAYPASHALGPMQDWAPHPPEAPPKESPGPGKLTLSPCAPKDGLRDSARHSARHSASLASFKGQTLLRALVGWREMVPSRPLECAEALTQGDLPTARTCTVHRIAHTLPRSAHIRALARPGPHCGSAPGGAMAVSLCVGGPWTNVVLPRSACGRFQHAWEEAGSRGGREILLVLCPRQEGDTVAVQGQSGRTQPTLALSKHSHWRLHATIWRSWVRENCGKGQLTPQWPHHIQGCRCPVPLPL